jgi:OmcA/MtrC family decaheme c-type cytochrome
MRIPSSVFAVGRYALALVVVAGSVLLMSAPKKTEFTVHDKAFYADQNTVNFVRPGLVFKIKSAGVVTDGTISVNFTISDPKGQPLDIDGIQTPGAVSVSFLAAYIPQGQKEFWSYVTRGQTSPITKKTEMQASGESRTTGSLQTVALGEYTYTFKQKAVAKGGAAWDKGATHRIGIYGSRNLTEFDLGTYNDDETITWVPAGGPLTVNRDVVRTGACNKCHDSLAAHGGSRKSVELCDMCHTAQTIDPDTGNSLAMNVFIHKLHMGEALPSVQAGTPYQIIGHNQTVTDYSTVVYPASPGDPRNCQTCHDPAQGATQQDVWMKSPTRAACGSCHDNVNFATGANHANLPQISDNQCSNCHMVKGELEFDTSILGAHTNPVQSVEVPGFVVKVTKVENAAPGKAPLVSFTLKTRAGDPLPLSQLQGGSNRLSMVLAGPSSDYGYTSFGADVTTKGYVSETANTASKCDSASNCTYQFTHSIPADAKGTFAVGTEARHSYTLQAGLPQQQSVTFGAKNDVFYFSVDGSTVQPRRQVVTIDKCNACHVSLSLHGGNRVDNIDHCVLCHNPSDTDAAQRPNAKDAGDKAAPAQGVNMAYMIHRIHTGEKLAEVGASYTVVGNGGSHNDFSEIRYPVMGNTGAVGTTTKCYVCHVNGSEAVLPAAMNDVTNPSAKLSPAGPVTSACTSCHNADSVFAHALSNTNTKFGESCDVCHGGTADFNTTKVHAGN